MRLVAIGVGRPWDPHRRKRARRSHDEHIGRDVSGGGGRSPICDGTLACMGINPRDRIVADHSPLGQPGQVWRQQRFCHRIAVVRRPLRLFGHLRTVLQSRSTRRAISEMLIPAARMRLSCSHPSLAITRSSVLSVGQHQGFRRYLSLYSPKMQRVPEVLQLSVIVERARPLSLEPEPSWEFNLVSSYMTAKRSILKEFCESRLVLWREPGFSFDELESLRVSRDEPVIQHKSNTETREIDVPGFEQRVEERNAAFA